MKQEPQVQDAVLVEEANEVKVGPRINLVDIEVYTDAIQQFKDKIIELVRAGTMSEQTGARIILDQEYGFFQQIVKVEYN
jgi:hypothetical protein